MVALAFGGIGSFAEEGRVIVEEGSMSVDEGCVSVEEGWVC